MKPYEEIVRAYFHMWLTKDRTRLCDIFHTDIILFVYSYRIIDKFSCLNTSWAHSNICLEVISSIIE